MKNLIASIFVFLTGMISYLQADPVPTTVTPTLQWILKCDETVTGDSLQFEITSDLAKIAFKNSYEVHGTVRRQMNMTFKGKETHMAKAEMNGSPVPRELDANQNTDIYFLDKKNDVDELGNQYSLSQGVFDQSKNQYPSDLLRVRMQIPEKDQKPAIPEVPHVKISHLILNLVLPEFRLRMDRKFTASGYFHYSINNGKIDIIEGLAHFECSQNVKQLN